MVSRHLIIETGSPEEASRKLTQFIIFFKGQDVLLTHSEAKQAKTLELEFGAEKGLLQDQARRTGQLKLKRAKIVVSC